MDPVVLILRFVHISAGAFWVGSALAMGLFVGPAVQATAEAGQQLMRHLIVKSRFGTVLATAGGLTVLAGIVLYWRDSAGFTSNWLSSGPGIGFGLGGVAATLGLAAGLLISRNTSALIKLAAEFKGQPTPEQMQRMMVIRKSQAIVGPLNIILLILATIMMSISRYLVF
jgi:uncharacterized membrane protein